ncbi:hypothetical protein GA0115261_107861, partial [Streptomyces sp. OspMP-M43]
MSTSARERAAVAAGGPAAQRPGAAAE